MRHSSSHIPPEPTPPDPYAIPASPDPRSFASLWEELHRPAPPLSHPVPRLTPPEIPPGAQPVVRFVYKRGKLRFVIRPADADAQSDPIPRPTRLLHRPDFLLLIFCGFLFSGCTVLNYSGPNGERFSRTSLGAQTALNSLEVDTATNGLRHLTLHGYQDSTTQALGTVTEAAVRAALASTPK